MPAARERDADYHSAASGVQAAHSAQQASLASQLSTAGQTVITDLNTDNFSGAWNTALDTSKSYGTNYNSATTDPLLADLESSAGLQALDPSKKWTNAEIEQYYNALGETSTYQGKQTGGQSLGKNPYGLWGSGSAVTGGADAKANEAAVGDNSAPDVERFAGARPTQSFLQKYGGDIAAIATAVIAPELAPVLADVGGAAAVFGGEAALGAAGVAGGDLLSGKAITGKGLLGGAVGGAIGATDLSSELGGGVLGGAGAGAISGGIKGAIGGTGALKGAELGAIGGGIAGAVSSAKPGLGAALGSKTAGNVVAGVGGAELTGLATSTLTSPSGKGGSVAAGQSTTDDSSSPGFLSGVGTGLASSLGGSAGSSIANSLGNFVGSAAPYAAVAGIGLAQAKAGEAQDAAASKQQQALAQPAITQSNTLLGDYNSGKINPTDQATSNTEIAQGQSTIQSAQGLSAIANQAFQEYNSGTLKPADQMALDQQTAAQKQQVAQQLASAGITDSTILAAQYQQIDNNAMIQKQTILNGYFNTGNQAYNSWLTATTEGQQTIQKGMEFASTSLQTELSNSMAEANIGIGEMNTAINTQMTTDANYASQVSTLMGTLATAYAKQVAGQKAGTSSGGAAAGGAAAGAAAKGVAGASSGLGGSNPSNTAGVSDASQNEFDSDTTLGTDVMQQTAGATLGENSLASQEQGFLDNYDDSQIYGDLGL